jgi:thiol:disulfide interchange protein
MRIRPRALAVFATLAAVFSTPLVAPPARADEATKDEPHVRFRTRTEPAVMSPGEKGVIVVEVVVGPGLHAYADKRFKAIPRPTPGLGFGPLAVKGTKTWSDPLTPDDKEDVFMATGGEARIPVVVDAHAALPISFDIDVKYSACDELTCYTPEKVVVPAKISPPELEVAASPSATPRPTTGPEASPAVAPASGTGTSSPAAAPVSPSSPTAAASAPPVAPTEGSKGYLFPRAHEAAGNPFSHATGPSAPREESGGGLLLLLGAFVTGILLAFTPCVLPIIPITVSIIGGGSGNVSRARLTGLLSSYVIGLALAFGTLGLVAAKAGASFSAAFQQPAAIWGIAGLFFVLSLGMYGIYELQPPAWLQKFQGSAKGGSVVGSFLFGALAAVIASPCTGPVIAGMVVYAAQDGNLVMGFLRFVSLGLGMGAVFFAAGSLNLVMRPGPWMVWVRHGFGVVMTGAALYYAANNGLLSPTMTFVVGFAAAALIGAGIVLHLVKKQYVAVGAAASQGAKVAIAVSLATFVVAMLTRPASGDLTWTTVSSREQVLAEARKAKAEGQGLVFDVWATWCHNCKVYDHVIENDKDATAAFRGLRRLRLDVTDDNLDDLRDGLGIPRSQQPYMVFVDKDGIQRVDLEVKELMRPDPEKQLVQRVGSLSLPPGASETVAKASP